MDGAASSGECVVARMVGVCMGVDVVSRSTVDEGGCGQTYGRYIY